jgi:hypothetical protein
MLHPIIGGEIGEGGCLVQVALPEPVVITETGVVPLLQTSIVPENPSSLTLQDSGGYRAVAARERTQRPLASAAPTCGASPAQTGRAELPGSAASGVSGSGERR